MYYILISVYAQIDRLLRFFCLFVFCAAHNEKNFTYLPHKLFIHNIGKRVPYVLHDIHYITATICHISHEPYYVATKQMNPFDAAENKRKFDCNNVEDKQLLWNRRWKISYIFSIILWFSFVLSQTKLPAHLPPKTEREK